jgi:hypothetical protein
MNKFEVNILMKRKTSFTFFLQYLVLILLFLTSVTLGLGQSPTKDNSDGKQDESSKEDIKISLEGRTEAILINDQPAIRILSPKGSFGEVKLQKRDGEDALVFDVTKWAIKFPPGKLYITKTKVIFVPFEKQKSFFNFEKSKIENLEQKKMLGGPPFIKIKYDGDEAKIIVGYGGIVDIPSAKAVNNFIFRAIKNFDETLTEFNQLTASVRPKPEEDEEAEKEEESSIEVGDKYDRFKDMTFIKTSRMLVRGTKRSIRAEANYSFVGKNQKKPEKILLSFYASASRPLFNEDDLELNFLADGKRMPLGNMRLADESKTKTTVKQTITIAIPIETFSQIANSKKAEFQIGTLEYKLTDAHLEAFRKLLIYKIEE